MQRGPSGHYLPISTVGEAARAFIPAPLPPVPALEIDGELGALLDAASTALGRLDGISLLLPDPGLFLYTYVRQGGRAFLADRGHAVLALRPSRSSNWTKRPGTPARRRRGSLRTTSLPWSTAWPAPAKRLSSFQPPSPGNARPPPGPRPRQRQVARRIPPQPELDRRHTPRQRPLRPAAAR